MSARAPFVTVPIGRSAPQGCRMTVFAIMPASMSAAQTAGGATLAPEGATPVEGSDGLLLELDGKIFPNYDATITHFDESEVVTGTVVRIDKDEVLLDIGWKSEGIIPSHELSIRRSVDPGRRGLARRERRRPGPHQGGLRGRLILSKKRARFEKAWRKIEAAAESGEPVEGTSSRSSRAASSSTSGCAASCPPRWSTSAASTTSRSSPARRSSAR